MSSFFGRAQLFRVFTSPLVHVSLSHLVFNALALIVLGASIERALGTLRYLWLSVVLVVLGDLIFSLLAVALLVPPIRCGGGERGGESWDEGDRCKAELVAPPGGGAAVRSRLARSILQLCGSQVRCEREGTESASLLDRPRSFSSAPAVSAWLGECRERFCTLER